MTDSTKTPQVLHASTTSSHLSDDQIDDHLIGDLAPKPAAHLAVCDFCQSRAAAASAPLAAFQSVSLAWSERRSATLPSRPAATHNPLWNHRFAFGTATAVLLLAIGIPFLPHTPESHPKIAATPTPVASPAPAIVAEAAVEPAVATPRAPRSSQIAHDNQILQAIDNELDASAESPNNSFGLTVVSTHPSARILSPNTRNWD